MGLKKYSYETETSEINLSEALVTAEGLRHFMLLLANLNGAVLAMLQWKSGIGD